MTSRKVVDHFVESTYDILAFLTMSPKACEGGGLAQKRLGMK